MIHHRHQRPKRSVLNSNQCAGSASRRFRRAAVLIGVLVVLFMVGMLMAQAVQTVSIYRRSDQQQHRLQQTLELVELGRLAVRQSLDHSSDDAAEGTVEIIVDGLPAEIRWKRWTDHPVAEESRQRYRVSARYPAGTAGEVTANWEN